MFARVLADFDSEGIDYCVLRNHELLAEGFTTGKDIDILILAKDFDKAREILRKYQFLRLRGTIPGHVQFISYVEEKRGFTLFDLYVDGPSYGAIQYLPGQPMLKRKRPYSTFFIPSKEDALITLLLHCIIDKGYFEPPHVATIESLKHDEDMDLGYIESNLVSLFGKRMALALLSLIRGGEYDVKVGLRLNLLLRRLIAYPQNIVSFTKFVTATRLLKVLNPRRGAIIAIIGTDGAGKSTVAKELEAIFQGASVGVTTIYMGWKDFVLPGIAFITNMYAKVKQKRTFDKEHPAPGSNIVTRFGSLAKSVVCLIEFIVRYAVKVYPKRRRGHVVITDRYAYDKVVLNDDNVNEDKIGIVRRTLLRLYPKPNFIFYLDNTPAILFERRKDEITLQEVAHQQRLFQKYESALGFERILTNQSVDDICNLIVIRTWRKVVELG